MMYYKSVALKGAAMTETEKDTIVVFTARSPDRIVGEGGSQAWVLNPARAKQCKWLVCTQNRHNPDHDFSDATEPHGSAFLIGKISAITQSAEEGAEDRWIIEISEFARLAKPDVWNHWRNPVRYVSVSELGISVDDLEFRPVQIAEEPRRKRDLLATPWPPATLTILEAKTALAATFGVNPDAVEITIRG
jgi:hypothetical protein